MNTRPLRIGNFSVADDAPPFIIAEMSGNHNGSLDRALQIVDAAAEAGAHALKIQTYTADTMTLDIDSGEFAIKDADSLWTGRTLYGLYQEAAMPYEWHKPIFDRCRERGVVGFSSPFDATAVDFLEELGVELFKIASAEIVDIPLIRRVARTGKPMIMSTGMATIDEIGEAVEEARAHGCRDIILLKCTSVYPAPVEASNVVTIPEFRRRFGVHVGFSDHTLGIGASLAAVAMGASVIEKHFTSTRAEGGVDAAFSAEPAELKQLVAESAATRRALGQVQLEPAPEEVKSRPFRRSLYITQDMVTGEIFSAGNLRAIRPGLGLPPKYLEEFLGKPIAMAAKRGTPLTRAHVADST